MSFEHLKSFLCYNYKSIQTIKIVADLLTVHHNIIIMSDLPVLTGAIQNSKLRNWMKINTCSFPAMWEKKYHQYMISDNYRKKHIYILIDSLAQSSRCQFDSAQWTKNILKIHVFLCFWLPQIHQLKFLITNYHGHLWYPVKWCQKYRLLSEKETGTRKPWGQGCVGYVVLVELENTIMYGCLWKKGKKSARRIKHPFISLYSEFAEEQTKSWSKHQYRRTCKNCFNIMQLFWMNNKTAIGLGFGMILWNSSDHTQPHPIAAKYCQIITRQPLFHQGTDHACILESRISSAYYYHKTLYLNLVLGKQRSDRQCIQ